MREKGLLSRKMARFGARVTGGWQYHSSKQRKRNRIRLGVAGWAESWVHFKCVEIEGPRNICSFIIGKNKRLHIRSVLLLSHAGSAPFVKKKNFCLQPAIYRVA